MALLLVLAAGELAVGVLAGRPLVLPAVPEDPAAGRLAARDRLGDRG